MTLKWSMPCFYWGFFSIFQPPLLNRSMLTLRMEPTLGRTQGGFLFLNLQFGILLKLFPLHRTSGNNLGTCQIDNLNFSKKESPYRTLAIVWELNQRLLAEEAGPDTSSTSPPSSGSLLNLFRGHSGGTHWSSLCPTTSPPRTPRSCGWLVILNPLHLQAIVF